MKKMQSGFTLIELMIVVAIIAILAAIAIPAYNQYIKEAKIAKVVDHYDEAVRMSKAELAKRAAQIARNDASIVVLTTTALIGELNPDARTAPDGTVAYLADADGTAGGQIGVTVDETGGLGFEIVTVHRADYLSEFGSTASTSVDGSNI